MSTARNRPPPPRPAIVQAGDAVLRAEAAPVPPEELESPEFQALVDRMIAAMRAAPGVGLAAPQLGVSRRVFVMEDREELMARLTPEQRALREREPLPLTVFVNPELEIVPGEPALFFEGCLSVAGYMALVERALEVVVRGQDRHGSPIVWRGRGWPARIAQHEFDHLGGTLYVDRMLARSFCANPHAAALLALPVPEVRRLLGA